MVSAMRVNQSKRDADGRRLLSILDVQNLFGLTHEAVHRRMRRGQLPLPVTRRPTRWLAADLANCAAPKLGRPRKEQR
jgi:hypothetical protein